MTPEDRFDALVGAFVALPGVSPPGSGSGFGSSALKVDGRIFAMLVRGQLVVKLPARRVSALVEAGEGERFDANKGTPMKEWLVLSPSSTISWSSLADEALTYVRR
jgi:hypothetical protein